MFVTGYVSSRQCGTAWGRLQRHRRQGILAKLHLLHLPAMAPFTEQSKHHLGVKAEGMEGLAKELRLKQPLAELLLGRFYNRT